MSRTRQWIALCLLAVYAMAGTAVFPATLAALAALEGSHEMSVAAGGNEFRMTLHHRQGNPTPRIADHASALGCLVATVCQTSPEGDHWLTTRNLPPNSLTESPGNFRNEAADLHEEDFRASHALDQQHKLLCRIGSRFQNAVPPAMPLWADRTPRTTTVCLLL